MLLNGGNGTFGPPVRYATGAEPDDVAVFDLNGDGWLDLAVTNWDDESVSVLLNAGDGTFAPAVHYLTYNHHPRSVAAGDINGDGYPELAVTTDDRSPVTRDHVVVLPNQADGTFGLPVAYEVGSKPFDVAVADLDGDGWTDLAVANYGSLGGASPSS